MGCLVECWVHVIHLLIALGERHWGRRTGHSSWRDSLTGWWERQTHQTAGALCAKYQHQRHWRCWKGNLISNGGCSQGRHPWGADPWVECGKMNKYLPGGDEGGWRGLIIPGKSRRVLKAWAVQCAEYGAWREELRSACGSREGEWVRRAEWEGGIES